MLYGTNRTDIREVYFSAWEKHRNNEPLSALEAQLVAVIKEHPEYHALLENADNRDKDFLPQLGEENPFLHLSLHHAIHEQLSMNAPKGICVIYKKLVDKIGDAHEAEHRMMEVLALCMAEIMQRGDGFDEQVYLERLRGL